MALKKLNNSKIPIIPFDKRLEVLRMKVLAPKKLALAKEIIARVGIPKTIKSVTNTQSK